MVRAAGGPREAAIWRPKAADQRRVIVTYYEPSRAWGITLNQHFGYFPMLLVGHSR
jgi:hypothetical protein